MCHFSTKFLIIIQTKLDFHVHCGPQLVTSQFEHLSSKDAGMAGMEQSGGEAPPNPLDPVAKLEDQSSKTLINGIVHPQADQTIEDSAVTKAEKYERHGAVESVEESPSKRRRLDTSVEDGEQGPTKSERQKGVAPIKTE